MKEILTFSNITDLITEIKLLKSSPRLQELDFFPIQPVRVGDKIGFVDWAEGALECMPLFDDIDRPFISYCDSICVRQGQRWGVLNSYFRYDLPVEHSYSVANQVCKIMREQHLTSSCIRKHGAYIKFS